MIQRRLSAVRLGTVVVLVVVALAVVVVQLAVVLVVVVILLLFVVSVVAAAIDTMFAIVKPYETTKWPGWHHGQQHE